MQYPTLVWVRAGWVILALLLAGLACNLDPTPSHTPTSAPTPSEGPVTVDLPTPLPPSFSVTAPFAPTQTLSSGQVPPTTINCNPRRDWPIYFVQSGDTISDLAVRTFTTVDELVAANCLLDAALIYEGQMLFLPFIPPTLTPIPTHTPTPTSDPALPVFSGETKIDNFWPDAEGRPVTYHNPVQVDAGGVQRAQWVNFFVQLPSGQVQYVGQDSLFSDGIMVSYRFPGPGTYIFQTVAENAGRRVEGPVFAVRYDPNFTPPEGRYNALIVTPSLGQLNGWYTLPADTILAILWPGAPIDALRVDFVLVPISADSTPRHLGTDPVPLDGANITWTASSGTAGYVQAFAYMADQSTRASEIVNIITP